jgi:hypothetical protein
MVKLWVTVTFWNGDPPCGHISIVKPMVPGDGARLREPAAAVAFTGWLGLLRVLSDLLARSDEV